MSPSPDRRPFAAAIGAWIAVALALVALAACGSSAREAAVPEGSVVLVIGDSITSGYGLAPDQAWPALLAKRTGWSVIAAGVSGDRSAGGRARLPALLERHSPALVIIELGGNDMLRGVPAADIVANLDAMIAEARAHGARVALMAVPQPTAMGRLTGYSAAPFYRELATRQKIALIENALPTVLSDAKLKRDELHPTAEGHAELAARASDELARIGLLRGR